MCQLLSESSSYCPCCVALVVIFHHWLLSCELPVISSYSSCWVMLVIMFPHCLLSCVLPIISSYSSCCVALVVMFHRCLLSWVLPIISDSDAAPCHEAKLFIFFFLDLHLSIFLSNFPIVATNSIFPIQMICQRMWVAFFWSKKTSSLCEVSSFKISSLNFFLCVRVLSTYIIL